MTLITKIELIDKVKTFYEQYLYFKDIHYAFLDIEGAFDHQEKAKTFLGVVACACIDSYLLTTARLFDTHNQAATIKTLIVECRQNISFFADQSAVSTAMDEYEKKLSEDTFENLLTVIKHRRNKYLAHNDPRYFLHSKATDAAVMDEKRFSLYELWFLINETGNLLECLWHNLTTDDIGIRCQYKRDLLQLFPFKTFPVITPLDKK